jgi:hypothetical protein
LLAAAAATAVTLPQCYRHGDRGRRCPTRSPARRPVLRVSLTEAESRSWRGRLGECASRLGRCHRDRASDRDCQGSAACARPGGRSTESRRSRRARGARLRRPLFTGTSGGPAHLKRPPDSELEVDSDGRHSHRDRPSRVRVQAPLAWSLVTQ